MLKGKGFLDYTNICSPNNFEKSNKIILKYFQWLKRLKNYIALFKVSIEFFFYDHIKLKYSKIM